ncbi:sideroflexin-2-like [Dendronephthya gigantea]|uniref:sideroflexin-2-like n=1 Tax=Dendronephthya gigantea TaxID=151771 RepID=UPI00106DB7DE|nr:sideroflexin-2-like [Dendronephthya gigantea]
MNTASTIQEEPKRIDLDSPRWDQSTFSGRFQHFAGITNMLLSLKSDKELNDAQNLLNLYREKKEPPGTTEDQVWNAKTLYESAFHPDSGEKMNLFGRMSFQVPGGMLLTGALLQFYRTVPQVVFWQWVNQSFNALVNYTNRNAKSSITGKQIGVAYVSSTTTAVAVSVGLNSLVKRAPPLVARYVPFVAVAAANCVNIPLSRQSEIINGIKVYNKDGEELGHSKRAAVKGISQVVESRIAMAAPGMLIIPIIMEKLEKYRWMQRIKVLHMPIQVLLCGVSLTFMVPAACSLFPQKCSMKVEHLEPELREKIKESKNADIDTVYFNKGL